ncbi:MAG: hypothetical protein R3C39_02880 [Dehalococcoidia bacterium]
MHRQLIGTYVLVLGSALAGLVIGVFVIEVDPAPVGWFFATGAGLMVGAFVAAIASNEPLIGRGALPAPPVVPPRASAGDDRAASNGRESNSHN